MDMNIDILFNTGSTSEGTASQTGGEKNENLRNQLMTASQNQFIEFNDTVKDFLDKVKININAN
jgi:hypothetical protein